MPFAERVTHLAPEGAYQMLARAQALEAQGRAIIHLEIGQPDAPTFDNVSQAGIRAIHEGHTRYFERPSPRTPGGGVGSR